MPKTHNFTFSNIAKRFLIMLPMHRETNEDEEGLRAATSALRAEEERFRRGGRSRAAQRDEPMSIIDSFLKESLIH